MKQTAKKTKNKKQKTKKAATKAKQSDELRMGEAPRRNHKDSTFCLLFSEPKRAIELYNAITGENLPPDTELTYTTLENALYVDRNNDLGFVIQKRHLVMSECQSSINWNIPMRSLGYVSRSLENLAGKEGLYGSKLVQFPAPEFYLFYVGTEKWSTKTLKLSDSFLAPPKENSIELVVNFINLNYNDSIDRPYGVAARKESLNHSLKIVCCDIMKTMKSCRKVLRCWVTASCFTTSRKNRKKTAAT